MRKVGLVLAGVVLGVVLAPCLAPSGRAFPAAEPRMVGTWSPDGYHAAARSTAWKLGDGLPRLNAVAEPAYLTTEPDQSALALAFTAQKGGAFTGTVTTTDGDTVPVVGAFRSDGRRFVYSTPFGSGSGEVDGDTMEWCSTDVMPNSAGATCTMYRKGW